VHARVSIFDEGNYRQVDAMLSHAREQILPQVKQMEGFKGMIALGDREGGKTLGITFWESEETMRASEEAGKRMRRETAETTAEGERVGPVQIAGVERYEVGLFEVES
jgi:heme-degrading monooxygenase HmoA